LRESSSLHPRHERSRVLGAELREAEAEFDAARRRTALNAEAKRLQRAKAELKRLGQEAKPA
jgi:hypothetical protein